MSKKEGIHYLNRLGYKLDDAKRYELIYWDGENAETTNEDAFTFYIWEYDNAYLIVHDDFWETYRLDVLVDRTTRKLFGKGVRQHKDLILKFVDFYENTWKKSRV